MKMVIFSPTAFDESLQEKGVDKRPDLCYNTLALKECELNIAE